MRNHFSATTTNRPSDPNPHVTLRFSTHKYRQPGARGYGWTIHIILDQAGNYARIPVEWATSTTTDKPSVSRVYLNRSRWPNGAGADSAPLAPGEAAQQTSTIQQPASQLHDAQVPSRSAWETPLYLAAMRGVRSSAALQPTLTTDAPAAAPPTLLQSVQWVRQQDQQGIYWNGQLSDGSLVYYRNEKYTDESGNEISQ